jgi:hypothetical protein
MKSESSSTPALELWEEFAQSAEHRESELGHPAPNCPTAAELWRVVEIVNEIYTGDGTTAQQTNIYIQELEGISDKWLDPESDPIGVRLHPALEEVIEGMSQSLEVAFPDSAELFSKKASLHKLKQVMQRTIYLRSLNPSWLNRFWARIWPSRS